MMGFMKRGIGILGQSYCLQPLPSTPSCAFEASHWAEYLGREKALRVRHHHDGGIYR